LFADKKGRREKEKERESWGGDASLYSGSKGGDVTAVPLPGVEALEA
jgi:hypothetical protein